MLLLQVYYALFILASPPRVAADGFYLVSKPWVFLHLIDAGENILLGSNFSNALVWSSICIFKETATFLSLKECSTLQNLKTHISMQQCAILRLQIQRFCQKET